MEFKQKNLKYDARPLKSRFFQIDAFFDSKQRELLEGPVADWVHAHAPSTLVRWSVEKNQDWLRDWKKHFRSFRLAGFRISPSWLKRSNTKAIKEKVIWIEPGMAFGTGTHATTRFAIELIRMLAEQKGLRGKKVIDVGAGSGILSTVSEKLGAAAVTAIDIDPESWRECRKHFKLNRSKNCKVSEKSLAQVRGTFDLVIANIIDGVLMDLKSDLWRVTSPGGSLILSGILNDGAKAFLRHFRSEVKGQVVASLHDEEWFAVWLMKDGA